MSDATNLGEVASTSGHQHLSLQSVDEYDAIFDSEGEGGTDNNNSTRKINLDSVNYSLNFPSLSGTQNHVQDATTDEEYDFSFEDDEDNSSYQTTENAPASQFDTVDNDTNSVAGTLEDTNKSSVEKFHTALQALPQLDRRDDASDVQSSLSSVVEMLSSLPNMLEAGERSSAIQEVDSENTSTPKAEPLKSPVFNVHQGSVESEIQVSSVSPVRKSFKSTSEPESFIDEPSDIQVSGSKMESIDLQYSSISVQSDGSIGSVEPKDTIINAIESERPNVDCKEVNKSPVEDMTCLDSQQEHLPARSLENYCEPSCVDYMQTSFESFSTSIPNVTYQEDSFEEFTSSQLSQSLPLENEAVLPSPSHEKGSSVLREDESIIEYHDEPLELVAGFCEDTNPLYDHRKDYFTRKLYQLQRELYYSDSSTISRKAYVFKPLTIFQSNSIHSKSKHVSGQRPDLDSEFAHRKIKQLYANEWRQDKPCHAKGPYIVHSQLETHEPWMSGKIDQLHMIVLSLYCTLILTIHTAHLYDIVATRHSAGKVQAKKTVMHYVLASLVYSM
jgi:hypothetical protein